MLGLPVYVICFLYFAIGSKCILVFKPDDNVIVLSNINYSANLVEIESYKLHANKMLIPFMLAKIPDKIEPTNAISFSCDENYKNIAEEVVGISVFALNLMNCKNIKYIPYDPNKSLKRQIRRQMERKKILPYLKYEILEIQPMRDRTVERRPKKELENSQRLHTVRGHFKTYTQENPLFGKLTGTYWWSDCIKGNAEIGLIDKDYSIQIAPNVIREIELETRKGLT